MAEYQGKKVSLRKPFKTPGESKKSAVYVRNKAGRVIKVRFGDPNMTIKKSIPARRKSFRARHKCSEKKDPTKASYWSCLAWGLAMLGMPTALFTTCALTATC